MIDNPILEIQVQYNNFVGCHKTYPNVVCISLDLLLELLDTIPEFHLNDLSQITIFGMKVKPVIGDNYISIGYVEEFNIKDGE